MTTGRPLPDPEYPDLEPYWRAAAEGRLVAQACGACGRLRWPPRPACAGCGSLANAWHEVSGRGRVYSWTVIGRAMLPGFEDRVPYAVVIVEAEDDPRIRFVGNLLGPSDRLAIGAGVEVDFETVGGVALPQWRLR